MNMIYGTGKSRAILLRSKSRTLQTTSIRTAILAAIATALLLVVQIAKAEGPASDAVTLAPVLATHILRAGSLPADQRDTQRQTSAADNNSAPANGPFAASAGL